jgi:hypothetical protein
MRRKELCLARGQNWPDRRRRNGQGNLLLLVLIVLHGNDVKGGMIALGSFGAMLRHLQPTGFL